MYPALDPRAVGIKLPFEQYLALARQAGFEGVGVPTGLLLERGVQAVRQTLEQHGLTGSHWGCPVSLSADDEETFAAQLADLEPQAALVAQLGCDRCITYMRSWSDTLAYSEHFERMARRIGRIGEVLARHEIRFGVEYLGPKTLREGHKHPFVNTLEELLSLLKAAGGENLGLLLDSWHWHCAGDSVAEIDALKPEQVILVHVNDAPVRVPTDQLIDNRREMPGATGVIDIAAFIGALRRIAYDGPLVAEPFNQAVNEMDDEAAAKATIAAIRKILAGGN